MAEIEELKREVKTLTDQRNHYMAVSWAAEEFLAGRITLEQFRETVQGILSDDLRVREFPEVAR